MDRLCIVSEGLSPIVGYFFGTALVPYFGYLQRIWKNYWQSKPVTYERHNRDTTGVVSVIGKSMRF